MSCKTCNTRREHVVIQAVRNVYPINGLLIFTGKGCRVWDLNERELIDMSIMGIGTNVLGYGDPEVDSAVARVISAGNMST